jgi:hypothetical protein
VLTLSHHLHFLPKADEASILSNLDLDLFVSRLLPHPLCHALILRALTPGHSP